MKTEMDHVVRFKHVSSRRVVEINLSFKAGEECNGNKIRVRK